MKKIVIGCAIVLALGFVALGIGGYLAYRAAKPMIDSAGNYIAKARELAAVGDRIANKAPYSPPKDATLTAAQVERFVAVQTNVREQLGDRWMELQDRAETVQTRAENRSGEMSVSDITGILSEFGNLYLDARRAQVEALNAQKFSDGEYTWVRRRVYEAAGLNLAGGVDMKQFEKMARGGTGSSDIQIPDIPVPEVPQANLKLVKPHMDKLKDTLALALLGL